MGLKPPAADFGIDIQPVSTKKLGKLFLRIMAMKCGGKTSNLSMVPKRPEKKHVFLSFDQNAMNGLLLFHTKRLGSLEAAEKWVDENIQVYHMTALWNPLDPQSAKLASEYTKAVFTKVLKDCEEGKVAGLFVEHYDTCFGDIGTDVVRAEHNKSRGEKLDYRWYSTRSDFMSVVNGSIQRALSSDLKNDLVAVVNNGEEEKEKMVGTGRYKKGANGEDVEITEVKIVNELHRAFKKNGNLFNDSQVRIDISKVEDQTTLGDGSVIKKAQFLAEVVESQHPHFRDGETKDVTGKGLAPFFGPWWSEMIGLEEKVVA